MGERQDIEERTQPTLGDSWGAFWPLLVRTWWVYMTGILLAAVGLVRDLWPSLPAPPPWSLWTAFSLALVVASFAAYHNLNRRAVQADNARIRTINALQTAAARDADTPEYLLRQLRGEIHAWIGKMEERPEPVGDGEARGYADDAHSLLSAYLWDHRATHHQRQMLAALHNDGGRNPRLMRRIVLGYMRNLADGALTETEVRPPTA